MGKGYAVTCGKCKHNNIVRFGVGMWYPRVYQGIVERIREGELGEEWRAIEASAKHLAVDARLRLYHCPSCGNWENEPDLSLYEPIDPSAVEDEPHGGRGAGGSHVPYVGGSRLGRDYRLLKRREHECPRCGSLMRDSEGRSPEALGLGCHECGARVKKWQPLLWD